MTTLISSEWYKIRKSRLLGFILLGVTAQTLLFILVSYVIRSKAVLGKNGGAAVNAGSTMFFLLALWIAAFIGFFTASEFQTGTIRNAVALGKNRVNIYLSKLFSACIAAAAIFTVFSIVNGVGTGLAFGYGGIPTGEWLLTILWHLLLQLPYYLTVAAVFTMFGILSRSPGMTALLGVGYMFAVFALMSFLGNFPEFQSALELFPHYYAGGFEQLNGDTAFIVNGLVVSAAYIVLPCIAGCMLFKKSDIK